MPQNDFLPIATDAGANVENQAAYALEEAVAKGFAVGESPPSNIWNKMLRQASVIASSLAGAVAAITGNDMLDNADVATIQASIKTALTKNLATGQCRLSVVSGVSLKLLPFNGNIITINGAAQVIPAAGVAITNAGLAANTLYYVYAWMNAGVMTLEFSATAHSTDATTGIEIKTGDATRSLVGMIYTSADVPGQFVDSGTQRFCANWFNRQTRTAANGGGGALGSGTANTDITPAAHAQILAWAGEVEASCSGNLTSPAVGGLVDMGVAVDALANSFQTGINVYVANYIINFAVPGFISVVAEGLHYSTACGSTDVAVTANFTSFRTSIAAFI